MLWELGARGAVNSFIHILQLGSVPEKKGLLVLAICDIGLIEEVFDWECEWKNGSLTKLTMENVNVNGLFLSHLEHSIYLERLEFMLPK